MILKFFVFENNRLSFAEIYETKTMREDFLHYLWRMKRFDLSDLHTTEGESLHIQQFGTHNTHAGPDFLNARVQIGDTLWAGNVEIHVNASEWNAHGHQTDKAYDNVILHVVLEEDAPILRPGGQRIPCLELRRRIPAGLQATYLKLLHNEHWIPCQHHFYTVSEMTKNLWLDRMLVERLERKTALIAEVLQQSQNNWEETFYRFLARNFGLKVNAFPFEMLAQSLPLLTLAKHKNNPVQTEALLFGQAGLLDEEFTDEYPRQLQKEYNFLRKKHGLSPIPAQSWRFLRMRPANFPSIRLAQFSGLIQQSVHLFSKILEADTVKEIENLFSVGLSDYWRTHYVFDKVSEERGKTLGKSTVHLFIINTIVPFLFLYGNEKADESYKEKAFRLLEELKPENNTIIKGWKKLGMQPASAYTTQALLELKNEYCDKKRCLECAVGNKILRGDGA